MNLYKKHSPHRDILRFVSIKYHGHDKLQLYRSYYRNNYAAKLKLDAQLAF